MKIEILSIGECREHRKDWERLFTGYVQFYRREMTSEIAERVWGWLHDPSYGLEGLMAFADGKPVGIAHYRMMPRPMAGTEVGFLDDLFVDSTVRGGKIGELMLQHLGDIGRRRGWAIIRWLTGDDNYRARTLYDRHSTKTSFNLYEMKL
ncbi:MAG: N-acetyltransferase family protein [Hyphomicrobiaceae bacterium]